MRAYEVAGDGSDREIAETALATTRNAFQAGISSTGRSLGLCHGMAGNADILLHAAQRFDKGADSKAAANARVAALVHSMPPGSLTHELESPSLMVGAAGAGYFLLRILDASLPSVLAIGPDS
jgi:lantibiotic modifying enzyme